MTVVQRVLDEVRAHARQDAPRECCGMLIGTPTAISDSARARNLADGTTRFLIDPQDHVTALRRARSAALDVVGFYHSHPRSPAFPSETDVAECGYAGVVHMIVGMTEAGVETRLFRLDGQKVCEVQFETTQIVQSSNR